MSDHIPNELLLDVFKFTDARDLRLFRTVSQKWNQLFLCQENTLSLIQFDLDCEIDDRMISNMNFPHYKMQQLYNTKFLPITIGQVELYKNVIFNNLRMIIQQEESEFYKQIEVKKLMILYELYTLIKVFFNIIFI